MITAVDSNVLLDIFLDDPTHGATSRERLRRAFDAGGLIASAPVWTEVLTAFEEIDRGTAALEALGLRFVPLTPQDAEKAATLWRGNRKARKRSGKRPRRIAPNYLIGAHALAHADRLLTRDRDFFAEAFEELILFD